MLGTVDGRDHKSPVRGQDRNPILVLDGDQVARQLVAVGEREVLGRRPDHHAILALEQPGPRRGREAGKRGQRRAGNIAGRVHVEPVGEPVRVGGDRVAAEIRVGVPSGIERGARGGPVYSDRAGDEEQAYPPRRQSGERHRRGGAPPTGCR